MRYLWVVAFLMLTTVLYAVNIQVTVVSTKIVVDTPNEVEFTVTVKNLEPLTPKLVIRASVEFIYLGLTNTSISNPIAIQIYHPILFENLRLNLPSPYLQKAPVPAFTLFEQQSKTFSIKAVLP
jgi:hypothetical protein